MLLVSTVLVGLSTPAFSQVEGWYVEGAGGVNWADDISFSFIGPDTSGDLEFDTGWAGRAAVGYGFGNGLRTEFEFSYRDNDIDNPGALVSGIDGVTADGDVSALGLMINALYDFDTGSFITPYVGVGIGASRVELESTLSVPSLGSSGTWSGSDTGFAAQGIAGMSFALTDQLSATLDYRYFHVFDLDLGSTSALPPSRVGTLLVDDDYASHSIMAGLRYSFAPPPPPPPAPAIAPIAQTSFIIFFDWDSAGLSVEANEVLDDVVVVANQTGTASLLLDGYTDLSGSAAYNLGLSERRANAAADGLIARGIAPDEIVIRAFGEENPLVPTPDGVREPQNRRVEIIMS